MKVHEKLVLVAAGPATSETDEAWLKSGFISEIVRLESASPSGLRWGSRVLGLGLDSAALALKILLRGTRGPFLAANPWIAVALRLVGKSKLTITGIYADEHSRSYRLLRRVLGSSPVITTVDLEAESWNRNGGRATPVLYGNTFRYPTHDVNVTGQLRIFVGGSSDRDAESIDLLEREIRSTPDNVHLVVASNDAPSTWADGSRSIIHTGWISNSEFGDRMSSADVVFLPLRQTGRAAGHMVTVGALEAGVPVAITPSSGMNGYVDDRVVKTIELGRPVLPQLQELADWGRANPTAMNESWDQRFSLHAYIKRVGAAIEQLGTPST